MKKFSFFVFSFLLFLNACSKDEKEISLIKENRQDLEMMSAYKEAYRALDEGDPYFAAKKPHSNGATHPPILIPI